MRGEVFIGGMKNAALPILFATILLRQTVAIENLPAVTDVTTTLRILSDMGARVTWESPTAVQVNAADVDPNALPLNLTTRLRGSSYLLGAELGRFGYAVSGLPGGCDFGNRPLDQHFMIFSALGAEVVPSVGNIRLTAPGGLHGGAVRLSFPSVGATLNGILAGATADGTTMIENAAREPHIVDLANFLNACGAEISGAGTSQIRINGVKNLHGCRHRIIPDMIEAGTYLAAAAATGGHIRLRAVNPDHLEAVTDRLAAMGASIAASEDTVTLTRMLPLRGTDIETLPYPGFPTDMQPQFAPLLCLSEGGGLVYERVWENRFRYLEELRRMGANVISDGLCARFRGGDRLTGTRVCATDLRAGAALLIAGLCAEGETTISEIRHIERGYPDLIGKFRSLGAELRLVTD